MHANLAGAHVDEVLARAVVEQVVAALPALEEVIALLSHQEVVSAATEELVAERASHDHVAAWPADDHVPRGRRAYRDVLALQELDVELLDVVGLGGMETPCGTRVVAPPGVEVDSGAHRQRAPDDRGVNPRADGG